MLQHWKRRYSREKFNNEPTEERVLRDRVQKLRRLVGKLTLQSELLKRGGRTPSGISEKRGSSGYGDVSVSPSKWGCQVMKLSRSTFYHKLKEKS